MDYEIIGNYYFYLQPIGNGSFSTIYKGFRIKDKLPVAIKKITKIVDKKYIDSEINLMKNLDSPYILKLYEVIHHKNNLYLILEYCNQGDLSSYISSNDNCNNHKYIYQIISGLKCLFESKIIHRDIKPHNILLSDNTVKISDFGFAKTFNDNDLISTFCGSPLYMAPEILKLKEYTNKADIWSLGVILYEIVFKKHPYPSKNKAELIKKLKSPEKIYIPYLEEHLRNLIERLLDKNDYTRINWEEIFEHEWFINYNKNKSKKTYKHELEFDILFEEDNSDNLHISMLSDKPRIRFTSVDNDIISQSTLLDATNKSKINVYEDSKVYSKSAPGKNFFLENYIQEKSVISNENNDYKILGKSPHNNQGMLIDYLTKSVNTVKNFLNI